MKNMTTVKGILIGLILLLAFASKAMVLVNVNVGSPPSWGPDGLLR